MRVRRGSRWLLAGPPLVWTGVSAGGAVAPLLLSAMAAGRVAGPARTARLIAGVSAPCALQAIAYADAASSLMRAGPRLQTSARITAEALLCGAFFFCTGALLLEPQAGPLRMLPLVGAADLYVAAIGGARVAGAARRAWVASVRGHRVEQAEVSP